MKKGRENEAPGQSACMQYRNALLKQYFIGTKRKIKASSNRLTQLVIWFPSRTCHTSYVLSWLSSFSLVPPLYASAHPWILVIQDDDTWICRQTTRQIDRKAYGCSSNEFDDNEIDKQDTEGRNQSLHIHSVHIHGTSLRAWRNDVLGFLYDNRNAWVQRTIVKLTAARGKSRLCLLIFVFEKSRLR